ncbi:MAG: nuclease-related domain-containing protein, partial [Candidatus Limnocylindrales bacterium]
REDGMKRLRLRYAGTCRLCGRSLDAGAEAFYDPQLRSVQCVACPVGPADAQVEGEAPMDPGPADAGQAGASAEREYGRRVTRRKARVEDRFGRRLGGVLLALGGEPQTTRAWAKGAAGEQELGAALADVTGIGLLHDRRVPGTRGNIDHLVIASTGVFVVDAKRHSGLIRIRDVGGLLRSDERLYVGRRDCSHLAEGMGWQVEAVASALAAAGIEPLPAIVPVLCFVDGEWPLIRRPEGYRGVRLEGPRSLKRLITREVLLDAEAIDRLTRLLAVALPPK